MEGVSFSSSPPLNIRKWSPPVFPPLPFFPQIAHLFPLFSLPVKADRKGRIMLASTKVSFFPPPFPPSNSAFFPILCCPHPFFFSLPLLHASEDIYILISPLCLRDLSFLPPPFFCVGKFSPAPGSPPPVSPPPPSPPRTTEHS